MFIPFEKLTSAARIWVYQAERKLTRQEVSTVSSALRKFTDEWLVHGQPLDASFDIRFDQFIILAANDPTSGCSIDSSVRVMKEIGAATGIDFFNRNLIAFRKGEEISLVDLSLLKTELQKGTWGEDTLFFNNVVSTLQDLEQRWLVPAGTTWLKRYIARPQAVQ